MTYLLHTKKRGDNKSRVILVWVLILCLILGFFARSAIALALSYTGNAIYSILPSGFRSAHNLAKENALLRDQVAVLVSQNIDRNILAAENERLKSGFGRDEKENIVYAKIIKRPPGSTYDTFILDVGAEKMIKAGDSVIFGSVVIGKIVEIGEGYSKAELFSSPGNTFDGMLGGNTQIQAKGQGGGAFDSKVPIGIAASVGDALILPSITSRIFGLVQSIEEKPEEGFRRLFFSLPINLNQIDAVGIIIK